MPAVTYLKAGAYQDGHAGYSDPLDEQIFLVNTINTIMKSPFWNSTAIIIAYDDSDGWYDHVIGPIVNQSATPDDNLAGPGSCGAGASAVYQGRCGYGPRQPLLVISPYAKVNYVDHAVTDLSSILRFIEDNWSLGRIGDNSTDGIAGSLTGMFSFQNNGATPALILDPNSGNSTGVVSVTPGTITQAIANPKNSFTTLVSITLDATASTSANGQPLTYQWASASTNQPVQITGAGTATPTVTFLGSVGFYTFILTVTDTAGNTSTDTVSVNKIK